MRTISEIYKEYKIHIGLRMHMLRVAGVASLICDDIDLPVEKDNIVTACLLHDMGNIIKSDLEYFPEFCEPEGLEYWLKVKEEFVSKYGNNEDVATDKIIRELGLEKILGIWEAFGFLKVFSNRDNSDFKKKIWPWRRLNSRFFHTAR